MALIKTDAKPASGWLLKDVRCSCNMSSKNPCGTALCSCRKSGINCISACRNCYGELCTNGKTDDNIDDDLNDGSQ